MENKFLIATKLFIIVFVFFVFNSCKQNQSVTQAKYKDLDKIAVEGQESVYLKKQIDKQIVKKEEPSVVLNQDSNIKNQEEVAETKVENSKSVKEKISEAKDIIKKSVLPNNTASTSSNKTTFKEKVKRSKLVFKHLKQLNKIKKAVKKDKSIGTVSILLLIIALILALILLALLGLDLITLLVLTLLVLIIYLLLTS